MITLTDNDYFAAGVNRRCYVNPQDSTQCLKIVIRGRETEKKQRKLHRRLLPITRYNPNTAEWQCYRQIQRLNDSTLWQHIPRCYGLTATTLGTALAVELLRHADGTISTPLIYRLQQGIDDSLKTAYKELCGFIRRSGFYTTSIGNINCVTQTDGSERLYLVECKYRRPGLSFIPAVRRRRIEKIIHTRMNTAFDKHLGIPGTAAAILADQ